MAALAVFMSGTAWVAAAAVLGLLLGLLLLAGRSMRRYYGLGAGRTVSLDNITLVSRRLRLLSRMDRMIRTGRMVIPEE